MTRSIKKITTAAALLLGGLAITAATGWWAPHQVQHATDLQQPSVKNIAPATVQLAQATEPCAQVHQPKLPEPFFVPQAPKRTGFYVVKRGTKAIPAYFEQSADFLAAGQMDNGAWPSTMLEYAPEAMNFDKNQPDVGSTSVCALALTRNGSNLHSGRHRQHVRKALNFLLETTENAPDSLAAIGAPLQSELAANYFGGGAGYAAVTQPQIKLGTLVDAPLMIRFFAGVLPMAEGDTALQGRIQAAMQVCVDKIFMGQQKDGSIKGGTWAGELQSGLALSALEQAKASGCEVDKQKFNKLRRFTGHLITTDGKAFSGSSAGVPLYALACSQRSHAATAQLALAELAAYAPDSLLETSNEVLEAQLVQSGLIAPVAKNRVLALKKYLSFTKLLNDPTVLQGYGNNGGEEYISFMLMSESAQVAGGHNWDAWHGRMQAFLEKTHNPDGTFSGYHCITSPTFVTAMAMLLLTADHDETLAARP